MAHRMLATREAGNASTLWALLLQPLDNLELKTLRWKIFRNGLELAEIHDQLIRLKLLPMTYTDGDPRTCWRIAERLESEDGKSIKLRLDSLDGLACESVVLFPRPTRATACLSTQVGCAVGCIFCATGRMGLQRNLTTAEIVEQLYYARQIGLASGRHLRNVVFMGMGEPLHNFEALVESLAWIIAEDGFGISPKHITVSTIGVPHRMIELAERFPLVRIALSLHSLSPSVRKTLVPRGHCELETLRATIAELNRLAPTHPVWLEYVLLHRRNDSFDDAQKLIAFCEGLHVEVNVIPYNEIASLSENDCDDKNEKSAIHVCATSFDVQESFIRTLRGAGIFTTLRKSLGQSISAACGQLAATGDGRGQLMP